MILSVVAQARGLTREQRNAFVAAFLGWTMDAFDTIVDCGNSNYRDDIDRAAITTERGVCYVDCGTSGGIWGQERGYCQMIGGEPAPMQRLDPVFAAMAPGPGTVERTPDGSVSPLPPSRATCTAGLRVRGTSSRWCTTASSTP